MADYVSPDARRRIAGGLMAAQYAENPPTAPMGYDFDAAPLSPGLMNFAAQRGQPGVIQKTLGLIPGFDQDGKRGAQSWGNALMSTAQFPIDAVAGMGQALTAPARAYRGEFDPTSEEGVGEALNVAGNAMMGGLAAPKPRNVVGKVEPPVSVTGYRGVTDPANINSPDRVTFYSDRPELADLYARDYQSYGRRWPWEDDKTMFANAARSDAAPWPSADRSVAIKGSDVGYSDGAAVARRDMTFNRPWTITGEELTGKIDAAGGFGIGDVLPDIVQQARSRGVDGIVLKDVQDIGGKQNQFISLFANGGKQGAGIGSAIGSAGGDLKGAALGAIPDMPPSYTSRANAQPPQPLFTARGYHGTGDNELLVNPLRDPVEIAKREFESGSPSFGPWGSASPRVAETYSNVGGGQPSILPVEYRFSNPKFVDAQGGNFLRVPYDGRNVTSDTAAARAKEAGHDGLVINNIRDAAGSDRTNSTTYAPLQPGTTYSATTGDLLYANGGRPGAATGAALGAIPDTPGIRAYHGSPHDFDKFDLSKIGTGEGAQAPVDVNSLLQMLGYRGR